MTPILLIHGLMGCLADPAILAPFSATSAHTPVLAPKKRRTSAGCGRNANGMAAGGGGAGCEQYGYCWGRAFDDDGGAGTICGGGAGEYRMNFHKQAREP